MVRSPGSGIGPFRACRDPSGTLAQVRALTHICESWPLAPAEEMPDEPEAHGLLALSFLLPASNFRSYLILGCMLLFMAFMQTFLGLVVWVVLSESFPMTSYSRTVDFPRSWIRFLDAFFIVLNPP